MSYADYIPHRMLLNRLLRKASGELRERIDKYQLEYERRVAECEAKIEATEAGLKTEREIAQAALDRELDESEAELQLFSDDIAAYVDRYLYHESLWKVKKVRKRQIAIMNEDDAFLSAQMRLMGDEIEILEARKSELMASVDVRDFIELSSFSDNPLILENGDDCQSLLERIETALSERTGKYDSERYALKRLKAIVQERAEHIYTVHFIDWIIRQKKLFSAQLLKKRDAIRADRGNEIAILVALEEEITDVNRELNVLAERVRMRWARPIVCLSADINYAYQEKSDVYARLREVQDELNWMKQIGSDNQKKWSALQRERKNLKSKRDDLKAIIASMQSERRNWHQRRRYVQRVCKNSHAALRNDGNKGKRDEMTLIEARLAEIQTIRAEGKAEAEAECEANRRHIASERDERLQALDGELSDIKEQIRDLEEERRSACDKTAAAEHKLNAAKASDKRFVLIRLIPTKEVRSALLTLEHEKYYQAAIEEKLNAEIARENKKQEEITETTAEYDKRISDCKPCCLRPTADELLEEKKLQSLRDFLIKQQRKTR